MDKINLFPGEEVVSLLNEAYERWNDTSFIEDDPISVPHRFEKVQDKEISGFFSAVFSWGNRKTIINKSNELMALLDEAPYDFILHHQEKDLKRFEKFTHRTFQATDVLYFIHFLKHHFTHHQSLEDAFLRNTKNIYVQKDALTAFHHYFFSLPFAPQRTKKHISDPAKKATCKRLNMFLRWMVRDDDKGVDFGIWKNIPASGLMIPYDVHVEKTARSLQILTRKQKDWQAVEELTDVLKTMDPRDPVKYDYALFGLSKEKMI
jgi:uncharacterized protein (TIGR02757 family)